MKVRRVGGGLSDKAQPTSGAQLLITPRLKVAPVFLWRSALLAYRAAPLVSLRALAYCAAGKEVTTLQKRIY